ncbi:hypothetical protein AB0K18_31470 [Nonomuraea sp. NPDC049421]|uniref:hypothetical protein n=1 Tax=Nonomuraea sp. NPDC049421 TaxID=3155275 RepID=UPI003443F60D
MVLGVVAQAVAAVALGDEAWDTAVAGLPLTAAWTAGFALVIGALAGRRPPGSATVAGLVAVGLLQAVHRSKAVQA